MKKNTFQLDKHIQAQRTNPWTAIDRKYFHDEEGGLVLPATANICFFAWNVKQNTRKVRHNEADRNGTILFSRVVDCQRNIAF